MKNNNLIKTIFVIATLLIVCTLSVPGFSETDNKAAEATVRAETTREEVPQTDSTSADAQTADTSTAADNGKENDISGTDAEKLTKHHENPRHTDRESVSESEERISKGRPKSYRSGHKNKSEGSAQEDLSGPHKKHPINKDFDDDDSDFDDKRKEFRFKDSCGCGMQDQPGLRHKHTGESSGSTRRPKHDPKQAPDPKESLPSVPEIEIEGEIPEIGSAENSSAEEADILVTEPETPAEESLKNQS